MVTFNKSAYREMSVEEILSIKIDGKHTFKPFDKVLVRNAGNDIVKECMTLGLMTED